MNVLETADAMRAWSRAERAAGRTIGFVPTMGALHEGHASLIRASAMENDSTAVSIFVNPAQFAPTEDFARYPRTWDEDRALCASLGVDAVYLPSAAAMYPEGYATHVELDRVAAGLESVTRPHFFRGVATVVAKLFNAVDPDRAYFGQKDAQQAAVIRRMTRDLDFGIGIIVCPIVRDPDGLAMSSRNRYLTAEERAQALGMARGLEAARSRIEAGERDARAIEQVVCEAMAALRIDYVALVDADTMEPVAHARGRVCLAAACRAGETRLIDNIVVEVVD